MVIGDMTKTHKAKLKKETNDDNLTHIQNPGNPEGHRSMASHFNVISGVNNVLS